MDGSGVLTRQAGVRMGEACCLGPWHLGRADDGGSCLPGAPKLQSLHVAWASF